MLSRNFSGYRLREIEVGMSPHYAIQVGDLLGDGKRQIVWAHSSGKRLVALQSDGEKLWEASVSNEDKHGVTALLVADVDGDGESEVAVGEHPNGENNVLILNRKGEFKRRINLSIGKRDYANCAIDSFGLADINGDGFKELVVAVNGGHIYVLDKRGTVTLEISGLPDYFEHFVHNGDLDGDGKDEILVSAANVVGAESPSNHNLFFVLDHDGKVMLVRSLREIGPDCHVDYAVVDVFDEGGEPRLVTSTGGCMFDKEGRLLWHLRAVISHGQWVDTGKVSPEMSGKQILFSELWHYNHGMVLVNHDGEILWTYDDVTKGAYPTHAHLIDWDGSGELYAIFGEQPGREQKKWPLKIVAVNPEGEEVLRIPFQDWRVPEWQYNYENSATVDDVDGDGLEELVFPTCKGTLMIIGKGQ